MDQLDMGNADARPAPASSGQSDQGIPFFRDSKFSGQLRSFYFDRRNFNDSYNEAWAGGGSLSFLSGYIADHFRIGLVGYTSQPLDAPKDKDGTLLLQPGQQGYTTLGQAYGEVKFTEGLFGAIGRKEYSTPFLNGNDVRMTPNTFEGVTLYGTAGGNEGAPAWKFGGGYISKIKPRNADAFTWMSTAAGAAPGVDRGVYLAGAHGQFGNLGIGAINYYSADIINIFYTESTYALRLADGYSLKLQGQFADQRSTGDDLLTGLAFATRQWGVKGDLGVGAAQFTVAYTATTRGADMRNPWSGYPGYTSVQVEDYDRAGESALMLKAGYDFSRLGAEGVSAYALYVFGSGRTANNQDEADLNLQWAPKSGALQNTSFRLRYGHVMQRSAGDPIINDFRLIVNYNF